MKTAALLSGLALSTGVIGLCAQAQSPTPSTSNAAAPDNSKSNQTDASNRPATADSQPETASDRQLVARIRKIIMADKSLSTYAHNIKIVSADGRVTLSGVVRSDDEKSKVVAKAVSVAGRDRVVNNLKASAK